MKRFGLIVIAVLFAGCSAKHWDGFRPTKIDRVTYHGWTNAVRLTSTHAEVVVVPQIGRVMSFRLLHGENVFWEDRSLDGQHGDATGKEWINFGGDKTWPSPEAEWGKYTGRKQWMPPAAFDALPVTATTNNQVVLTSPVDPHYGIRTIRRISLYWSELTIETTYERVSGEPSKVGVWVITQFKEPVAVYVPVKTNSIFAEGYFQFGKEPWPQLYRQGNRLEIIRDPKLPHKMGNDARRLIWLGEKEMCAVTAPERTGGEYPDGGASAEVYTNPDPKKYVELEMLSPLSLMKPGDRISFRQSYALYPRPQRSVPEERREWFW